MEKEKEAMKSGGGRGRHYNSSRMHVVHIIIPSGSSSSSQWGTQSDAAVAMVTIPLYKYIYPVVCLPPTMSLLQHIILVASSNAALLMPFPHLSIEGCTQHRMLSWVCSRPPRVKMFSTVSIRCGWLFPPISWFCFNPLKIGFCFIINYDYKEGYFGMI